MTDSITRTRIDLQSTERFVSLRRDLGVTSFGINQMNLAPGQRGRIHRHREQEEVYVVLQGTLTLIVEEESHEFSPHDVVRVPASVRRQLVNRGAEVCTLIALGGSGEHAGRDGEAFARWEDQEGRPPQDVPLPDDL